MREGTSLLLSAARADAGCLSGPSALPGWTRKHVIAHVAANADALRNLVHWAATGEATPMYASPEQRVAAIESGSRLRRSELTAWLDRSVRALDAGMAALTDAQWQAKVVTGQGRTVAAAELPWLRAREVFVHAVDLDTGTSFADMPAGFLAALCDDVVAKRDTDETGPALRLEATDTGGQWRLHGSGNCIAVTGPLAELAAYLTGRAHHLATPGADPAPSLAAWL